MAFTSQGFPYTWVARMASVLGVMAASILSGSIFNESLSISAKIGVQPSQTILLVVATKEKGVVIISPERFSALIAICKATVPLVTNNSWSSFKWPANFASN